MLVATDLPRSALGRVLLLPEGIVEIGDTLIEGAAARFNTHIGAGQTRMLPIDTVDAQTDRQSDTLAGRIQIGF
jgi:hypothetical protein